MKHVTHGVIFATTNISHIQDNNLPLWSLYKNWSVINKHLSTWTVINKSLSTEALQNHAWAKSAQHLIHTELKLQMRLRDQVEFLTWGVQIIKGWHFYPGYRIHTSTNINGLHLLQTPTLATGNTVITVCVNQFQPSILHSGFNTPLVAVAPISATCCDCTWSSRWARQMLLFSLVLVSTNQFLPNQAVICRNT